jgi:hypothetical protein
MHKKRLRLGLRPGVPGPLYAHAGALPKPPLMLNSWLRTWSLKSNKPKCMDFQPKRMGFHTPFYSSGVWLNFDIQIALFIYSFGLHCAGGLNDSNINICNANQNLRKNVLYDTIRAKLLF